VHGLAERVAELTAKVEALPASTAQTPDLSKGNPATPSPPVIVPLAENQAGAPEKLERGLSLPVAAPEPTENVSSDADDDDQATRTAEPAAEPIKLDDVAISIAVVDSGNGMDNENLWNAVANRFRARHIQLATNAPGAIRVIVEGKTDLSRLSAAALSQLIDNVTIVDAGTGNALFTNDHGRFDDDAYTEVVSALLNALYNDSER